MAVGTFRPSSFLATKGPLIVPTFRAFRDWDLSQSQGQNIDRICAENTIGAPSSGWLKDFRKIFSRRFDVDGRDRLLVEAVKLGWDLDAWAPMLLWHMAASDPLLRTFIADWLFALRADGIARIRSDAAKEFLRSYFKDMRSADQTLWSKSNIASSANGLLRAAVDFHLLRGRTVKEFEAYRLPEQSLVYLLHALMERENNSRKVVHAADWRLYLMQPKDVEEELLRLHQFGKLRFERAGSLLELTLPYPSTAAFIRSVAG